MTKVYVLYFKNGYGIFNNRKYSFKIAFENWYLKNGNSFKFLNRFYTRETNIAWVIQQMYFISPFPFYGSQMINPILSSMFSANN